MRDGLGASWVRIRLAATDGELAASPAGVAGRGRGRADRGSSTSCRATRCSAASSSGPRRRGDYSDAERTLLRTVAGQAAASVANVRLTAQLAEQLDELTASRERLVAAQDDERKRLERDLHDGIQQNVVAQIAGLRLARNRLERGELDGRRAGGAAGPGPGDAYRPARARPRHPPAGAERQRPRGGGRVERGAVPDPADGRSGRRASGPSGSPPTWRRRRTTWCGRRSRTRRSTRTRRAPRSGSPGRTAVCGSRSAMTGAASARLASASARAAAWRTSATGWRRFGAR